MVIVKGSAPGMCQSRGFVLPRPIRRGPDSDNSVLQRDGQMNIAVVWRALKLAGIYFESCI